MTKTRSEEDAFRILKALAKKLDCTYPPEDLAKLIGFNKIHFSGVTPFIRSDGYKVFISFELGIPYEQSDWEDIPIEHDIFDKYCQ